MNHLPSVLRRTFEGAAIACFAVVSFCAAAQVGLEPRDSSRGIGVIFAPWTSADAALSRAVQAGGRFVRFGGFSFVVVVMPDVGDYAARSKSEGALLVVDPLVLEACLRPFLRGRASL
ncbi:MAG: hypothetical protein QOG83_1397 [Alphaproteobacteria bacterium]|nr:hypothetical protein [Alphaproteobacteria bacterium]